MQNPIEPVPPHKITLSSIVWQQGVRVLNPQTPHFQVEHWHGKAVCDLVFSVTDMADMPVIFSIKGDVITGSISISVLNAESHIIPPQPIPQTGELSLIAKMDNGNVRLRISAVSDAPTEFMLRYLNLSYSPHEGLVQFPAPDPILFPDWEQIYQLSGLTASQRLRRQNYLNLTAPTPMEWHRTIQVMLYPDSGISAVLATSGFYEPHECLVLKKVLREGDVFVDCGANIGLYSLYAAALVGGRGRVLAFEPSPREIARLKENIRLNDFKQIDVFPYALSDTDGTTTFNLADAQKAGQNTLGTSFGYADTACAEQITVPLRRLDDVCAGEKLPNLRLIKIDVEGAELHVLRGAMHTLKTYRPVLLLEIFPSSLAGMNATVAELEMFLREQNYIFYSINNENAQWDAMATLSGIVKSTNIVAIPQEKM
jgi:FkbM family methyltransferase